MNVELEMVAAERGGWFSRRDAIVAGYSDADLRRHVASGEWMRVTRGAYAPRCPAVEAMPPWEQAAWVHGRAARATYHRLGGRAVVSHQSALLLHGVRVSELDLHRVHVTRMIGSGRSDRAVCQHGARPAVQVICELDGVRTTTPARAVVETVRSTSLPVAVSVVDQVLRLRLATPQAMTAPLPQAEIRDEHGKLVGRVDFLFEQYGVIVEFDGAVKYADGGPRALLAEKVREDHLRDLGYQVVRVSWPDLSQPAVLLAKISRAIARSGPLTGYVTARAL
ncbi:type IV toxin-antitoxin system AbiEi family antitoxin domain-containing protein [Kribbella sp. NPDC048928]|uniref:type IV toxin-antitoxin system AbiEi family antitoxin domain-containing protein n=1 Tax=Kribbella sp. NPDC048928 TaxID=3364111 RepID=UPI00371E5F86